MLPGVRRIEHHEFNLRLLKSLFYAARIVDGVATDMYHSHGTPSYQWQRTILGHTFSVSQAGCYDHGEGAPSLMNSIKAWLTAHEEAQVMLASVLVVVGLWWLVRTILALLINLICPLMVVLLAVIMVPQLRGPLLGHNYPAVANIMSNILTKLGENIKPHEL
ncbi:uncharacterized protein LOC113240235 isoform X2 [Hyposmocoma kahamanoa]|uniref:uncharacterized protein LOC113240235 isoform X2 n=1 Tax=Hyposmocoma kahamanoa TaxID=1477025 RepID=UPI000E6D7623|nr:uncharacterized protein LOC113240235 isoform X2 [Hyposmocoma kahamanoa]